MKISLVFATIVAMSVMALHALSFAEIPVLPPSAPSYGSSMGTYAIVTNDDDVLKPHGG